MIKQYFYTTCITFNTAHTLLTIRSLTLLIILQYNKSLWCLQCWRFNHLHCNMITNATCNIIRLLLLLATFTPLTSRIFALLYYLNPCYVEGEIVNQVSEQCSIFIAFGVWFEVQECWNSYKKNLARIKSVSWGARADLVCAFEWRSAILAIFATELLDLNWHFLAIDSKEASRAKAASAMSLDGALDSGDLQSFAYQIANGMVSRFIFNLSRHSGRLLCMRERCNNSETCFQAVMTNFLTGVSSYHTSRLVIVFSLTV